jgi:hypothetical protein
MKTIYYFAPYDTPQSKIKRGYSLAATTKIDYIISTINQLGYNIILISTSYIIEKKYVFDKGGIKKLGDKATLFLSPSFGTKTVIGKYLGIIFTLICFFFKLLSISKNSTLFVYHAPWYFLPVKLAKKIRGFRLILEVEEIYADVHGKETIRKKEYDFFKLADAYLFATELLNEKINTDNKPYVVIYGTYNVEQKRNVSFEDDKIHCVYAGTFDPRKGGAVAAATTAAALMNDKYHIHIIGFGNDNEKKYLFDIIDSVSKTSVCKVTYDGSLTGEDYIGFLQKCNIGLSTQISDAEFNDTSFPSKILSYMANGLRVVSVRIKALEVSQIGKALYYYDGNSPQAIANAIKIVDVNDNYDGGEIIKELHNKFIEHINNLITTN